MKHKIELTLNKIRPYIQMHGGDVRLISIKNGTVKLGVYGACTHCALADLTYNKMVGEFLHKEVSGIKDIIFEMIN